MAWVLHFAFRRCSQAKTQQQGCWEISVYNKRKKMQKSSKNLTLFVLLKIKTNLHFLFYFLQVNPKYWPVFISLLYFFISLSNLTGQISNCDILLMRTHYQLTHGKRNGHFLRISLCGLMGQNLVLSRCQDASSALTSLTTSLRKEKQIKFSSFFLKIKKVSLNFSTQYF